MDLPFPVLRALEGAVLPAAVSTAAVVAAAVRAGPAAPDGATAPAGSPAPRGWPGALAVGPGFLAAFLLIKGWKTVPGEVAGWLGHAAFLATALGLVEGLWPARAKLRWALRAVAVLLVLLATLRPKLGRWEPGTIAAALLGLELLGLSFWLATDRLRAALPGPGPDPQAGGLVAALGLAGLVGASAGLLGGSGSALMGQLGGALAAASAPIALAAWWRPGLPLLRGAAPALTLLLGALVLNGAFYTGAMRTAVPLLLLLAPWGANLALLPPLRARPAWQRAAVAAAGVLLPLLIAGGVVLADALAEEEDPYAGY